MARPPRRTRLGIPLLALTVLLGARLMVSALGHSLKLDPMAAGTGEAEPNLRFTVRYDGTITSKLSTPAKGQFELRGGSGKISADASMTSPYQIEILRKGQPLTQAGGGLGGGLGGVAMDGGTYECAGATLVMRRTAAQTTATWRYRRA